MAEKYALLQHIQRRTTALLVMLLGAVAVAIYAHLSAGVASQYRNIPLEQAISTIATSIVPNLPEENLKSVSERQEVWSRCKSYGSTKERMTWLDGELRALGSNGAFVPGMPDKPYRIDYVHLESELQKAQNPQATTGAGGKAPVNVDATGNPEHASQLRCKTLKDALIAIKKRGLGHYFVWKDRGLRTPERTTADGGTWYVATKKWLTNRSNPWQTPQGCVLLRSASGRVDVLPTSGNDVVDANLCGQVLLALNPKPTSADKDAKSPSGFFANWRWWGRSSHGKENAPPLAPIDLYKAHKLGNDFLPVGTDQLRVGLAAVTMPKGQHNTLEILGNQIDQGPHLFVTLDADKQKALQALADCYTGQVNRCGAAEINAEGYYENANARMVGALMVDIETGKIVAAASAHTPCYEGDYSGRPRSDECPDLPSWPRYQPEMLTNHALYFEYMSGSLVKPLMVLAMFKDAKYRSKIIGSKASQTSLKFDIAHSNSAGFMDRFLCADNGYIDCERPLHVAEIANAVGWNYGCEDMSSGCGRYGLLTGAPLWGGQAQESPSVFSGIWGLRVTNNGQRRVLVGNQFDATKAQACANEFWHAKGGEVGKPCPGHDEVLNNLLRIGLGQGDTRVTPLGVALMLSHLGNAYNTKGTLNLPHLFEEVVVVRDGKLLSSPLKPDAQDVTLDREAVSLILAGMQDGVKKGGTGHEACSNAFKKQGECNSMSWIAGKTGTPGSSRSLNNENWKLACAAPKDANGRELVRGAVDKMPGGCAYQSVKWYAALVGDPKKGTNKMQTWRYAIVVAVQRNWMKNGVLPEDNTAAELAMRYFHDHLQPTFGVAKQK